MKKILKWMGLALLVVILAFSGWRAVVYRHAWEVAGLAARSGGQANWVYRPLGMEPGGAAASRFWMVTRTRIFNDIDSVTLGDRIELSPSDLRRLRGLPRLRRLVLKNPSFRSESWRVLGSLDGLEELELHFAGSEEPSLRGVGKMRQIRHLILRFSNGDSLPSLRYQDSEWWRDLSELKSLERLFLHGFRFRVAPCLKHLPELPSLLYLRVVGRIDEEDLTSLARFESLTEFDGGFVELSDGVLDDLNRSFPSLERIGTLKPGSPLTVEGRRRLEEAGITVW